MALCWLRRVAIIRRYWLACHGYKRQPKAPAALIAECFTPRLRYTGTPIGYQLSSIISGGPAPLIATARRHGLMDLTEVLKAATLLVDLRVRRDANIQITKRSSAGAGLDCVLWRH
jgi:hypothetical protein